MIKMSNMILILFSMIVYSICGTKFDYEPYSILKEDRIVGFFPLDRQNLSNIAPHFDVNKQG